MRVAGIIAEYNPLHNGHLRLIEKIRDDLGGQTPVLVIMSGEFVQRGIPAITDRTARVCALLSCGADVVLELPFTFATGSADRFAKGGILSLIGSGVVTDLYFGAEHASLEDLSYIAGLDPESDPAFLSTLESLQKDGQPYAAAWEQALLDHIRLQKNCDRSFLDSLSVLLHQPNNILAISYLRELKRAGSAIEPHVLLRENPYHEENLQAGSFPSATAIRKTILEKYEQSSKGDFIRSLGDLIAFVPDVMLAEMLYQWNSGTRPMSESDLISAALPILRALSTTELAATAHMGEQLAGHLKSTVRTMHYDPDISAAGAFRQAASTRCFAYTRILRALSSLVIGQKDVDLVNLSAPKYLRLLGFSEKGRSVLKSMRADSALPILSRTSDALHFSKDPEFARMDELDRLSHDFWTSRARGTFEEDFKREVIQYKRGHLYR
ncbi:MAG: nucleotidyltransferase family protein [Clostridiales bacterium]|nr:nucleotidyltransferase family protein [Clostridiales bacterium]